MVSRSFEIADRFVNELHDRLLLLANTPYAGRRRDDDLSPGLRSFAVEEYEIVYRVAESDEIQILRVLRGSRDIERFFT